MDEDNLSWVLGAMDIGRRQFIKYITKEAHIPGSINEEEIPTNSNLHEKVLWANSPVLLQVPIFNLKVAVYVSAC